MIQIQPCDWQETDINYKYVVDVYGRTADKEVVRVRITDFKPYFYLKCCEKDTVSKIRESIRNACQKPFLDVTITREMKLDAMNGFSGLIPIPVWKLTFSSLWTFKTVSKVLKNSSYESNLPPLLRLFHELNLSPASPIEFEEIDAEDPDDDTNVDICYTVSYTDIKSCPATIPLYIAAYDIETYSSTGNFPLASIPADEIMQIGVSFRSTEDLLKSKKRYVFVSGDCIPYDDPDIVSCKNEKDLLRKFEECIHNENPDIIAGYNTFGFDDSYIADRAIYNKINLNFGRHDYTPWKTDLVKTEKKTFELASGKFAVRYIEMAGRLPIDLLLSIRREHNLDSYKLDNVANTVLRDKVLKVEKLNTECLSISFGQQETYEIHTKSTRGLFVGNYVQFDIVTNTVNPYNNGKKYKIKNVYSKKFTIQVELVGERLFEDLEKDELSKLAWSFTKDDITAVEMWSSHHGSPESRSRVAKYCIQDCDLVITLMAKLDTLVNARGMADVCKVPIQYIFLRGQGIKIYSAVVYNASKRNQIIVTQESIEGDVSYEGAIVLPPKIGMYLDQPIPVLDFNSLYPSNMIAFNLSPDTLLFVKTYDMTGKLLKHEGKNADDYPNFKVDEISYDLKNDDGKSVGRVVCGYIQPTDDPNTVGLLPLSLDILLKKRKETRKKMETTEDDAQKSVLNGLQLAYKVVANSVYGQCGSKTSPIRKFEVAASTTAVGRMKIHEAKQIVVSEFGAEVIYGDSVASYTPILFRVINDISILSIEELGNICGESEWKPCTDRDKEYVELQDVESWTEEGWKPVYRVIRHKLAPHKKMVRVLTHTGLVDVTDDHSLLRLDGSEVSSKELNIGDELLHAEYPETDCVDMFTEDEERIVGFFIGCGICDTSWSLNNENIELLEKYKKLCKDVFPVFDWTIIPEEHKLVPLTYKLFDLKDFIKSYRRIYYVGERKNIPALLLNGHKKYQQAFWEGFCDANCYIRFDTKNEPIRAQLSFIGHRLGYSVSFDEGDITSMSYTKIIHHTNPNAIKKMYEIPYEGYVYDLTTDNHHFQAGVGKMIVHNTDSIFVKFPTKDLQKSMDMAKKAAEKITSLCRKAHRIEYEKTFYPFILFSRKRYVGMMYEDDIHKCSRKSMGIALKRRDNAPIVKDIYGGALDILLEKRDIRLAQEFVQNMLVKVLKNEIPLEKFIVTKQLRDDYKNPGQIAHRVLADRMTERDAGSAPQVGDRLPYIYVSERSDKKKQGDKIEHVDYVRAHNLKPDTEFYITNQIQNPVAQLFALALEDLNGYVERVDYKRLLSETIEAGEDEEDSTISILKQKEKELETLMFMGAQYLKKWKRGPIDKYFQRK